MGRSRICISPKRRAELRLALLCLLAGLSIAQVAATVAPPRFPRSEDFDRCPGGRDWENGAIARADREASLRQARRAPGDPQLRAALLRWSGGKSAGDLMFDASLRDANARLAKSFDHAPTAESRAEDAAAKLKAAQMRVFLKRDPLPGLDEVGEDGLEVLWYGVLSIENDPESQLDASERFLSAQIAAPGAPSYYVYDVAQRIDQWLIEAGKPQRYGTVHEYPDRSVIRPPSDDERVMEARRAKLGLMPAGLETCLRQRLDNPYGMLPMH